MGRTFGVLLHLTSLPGAHGIGALGAAARGFVDYLADARVGAWQLLPVTPPGLGASPYSSLSAFAGNPLLIDLEGLAAAGWLPWETLAAAPAFPAERVDSPAVTAYKTAMLRRAFDGFQAALPPDYAAFCTAHAGWLDDYALFMAARAAHGDALWTAWEPPLARREPAALAAWRARLADEIAFHRFVQYAFFTQWAALRDYAHGRGVRLIGDLPLFVSHDSADVWSRPALFQLDAAGQPTVVAGVPPDFFSPTGQRWGNPLYRWPAHRADGFAWWIARVRHTLGLVDRLRIDHFRGFSAAWTVAATEPTAARGHWEPAPGAALFTALRTALGDLPFIAEDLGLITPDVIALRDQFGLPGMAILQYAFPADRAPSPYLPHRYVRNLAAYTGTHDNDTIVGWWTRTPASHGEGAEAIEGSRQYLREYLQTDGWEIHRVCLHTLAASVADLVVAPLQDVLGLGNEARMNYPGTPEGNWAWRVRPDQLTPDAQAYLRWLLPLCERG